MKLLRDYDADINAPMGPGRTPPPLMAVLRRQLRALLEEREGEKTLHRWTAIGIPLEACTNQMLRIAALLRRARRSISEHGIELFVGDVEPKA